MVDMGESLIKVLQEFRGRRDHVQQGCLKVTMELVPEQGLEGWTRWEQWRLEEGHS